MKKSFFTVIIIILIISSLIFINSRLKDAHSVKNNNKNPPKNTRSSSLQAWEKPHSTKDPYKKSIAIAVEFTSHSSCAHIALNKKWYAREGLKLKSYNSYVTGMALASALNRGEIDAAYICLVPAINARANAKIPIKIVSGVHKYGYGLVVDPEKIKSVKDLEKPGIRIACSREGSPTDILLNKMIEKYQLDRDKILRKVRRMNPPRQLIALRTGGIDAAFMCEQYPTMAEKSGFKTLLSAKDIWHGMHGSVLVVTEDLINNHPHIVEKLVKVTDNSTKWMNENIGDASGIVASELSICGGEIFPVKSTGILKNLDISADIMKRSLKEKLVNTTDIDSRQIQETIDYMTKLGYIKKSFRAEEIICPHYMKK